MNSISIVLTPDAGFELPLCVLLHRLSHLHPESCCRVFVLHDNIPEAVISRVASCISAPTTLEWLRVPSELFAGCFPPFHLPRACLFSLALSELLPQDIRRVIYLDVDTFPIAPLTQLWRIDLGAASVAAVRGAYMPWVAAVRSFPWQSLGIAPEAPYFNNGVMLVDLDAWRRDDIYRRSLTLLAGHTFAFADQDALNVIFASGWKALHPRWNLQTGHFANPCLADVAERQEDLAQARAEPLIVHYNGPTKPWHDYCAHPLARLWRDWSHLQTK